MDLRITIRALRSLYQVCTRRNRIAKSTIRQYLTNSTTEHCVKIKSQIIRCLSRIIPRDTPEFGLFFLPSDREEFIMNVVPHFIHVFLSLAKIDDTSRAIVLAADILGLMRPLLEKEFQGHASIHLDPHDGDLSMVYYPPDFALLALIKEHGLEALLPEPPAHQMANHAFQYQRSILCSAFSVFLTRRDRTSPVPWFLAELNCRVRET